jgi:hypothetical protein
MNRKQYPENKDLTHFDCGSDYHPDDDISLTVELTSELYDYGTCAGMPTGYFNEKYPLYLSLDGCKDTTGMSSCNLCIFLSKENTIKLRDFINNLLKEIEQ